MSAPTERRRDLPDRAHRVPRTPLLLAAAAAPLQIAVVDLLDREQRVEKPAAPPANDGLIWIGYEPVSPASLLPA